MVNKLSLTAILATFYCSIVFANETIKMAVGEYPPYTSKTEENGNFLEKIVTAAFKLESIDVEYSYLPWKRGYASVKSGDHDGTFPWNNTSGRDDMFYIHSVPLAIDDGVYFHLESTPFNWERIEDLKNFRLGITLGYKHKEIYQKKGVTISSSASELLSLKMLLAGRIDVYRASKDVGYYLINNKFSSNKARLFTHHPKVIEITGYYILFSKNTPNGKTLSEKFDSGLNKLIESGAYDKIASAYCRFLANVAACASGLALDLSPEFTP